MERKFNADSEAGDPDKGTDQWARSVKSATKLPLPPPLIVMPPPSLLSYLPVAAEICHLATPSERVIREGSP